MMKKIYFLVIIFSSISLSAQTLEKRVTDLERTVNTITDQIKESNISLQKLADAVTELELTIEKQAPAKGMEADEPIEVERF